MYRSVLLIVLAAAGSAAAADQALEMEASLKPKLLALLHESKAPRPIARTLQTEEWQFKGRLGKKVVYSRSLYVPQEAGLVRTEGATSVGGSLEAVLVCGLVALTSYRFSPGDDVTTETQIRLTGFETASSGICGPVPGAEFSYRMQTESRVRQYVQIIGRIGGPRTIAETFDVLCKAGDAYLPAREILHSLEGDALMVRCERKSTAGHVVSFDYAFLPQSGLYLRLGDQSDGGKTAVRVRYTEVRYRNQE
jgi:hypothetical protein